MTKKFLCIFLTVLMLFSIVSVPAGAFEPMGYNLTAKNVLLVSLDTGEEIYSKGADERVYPASITKIMTVLLFLESEKFSPDMELTMTDEVLKLISGTGSSVAGLKAGEIITGRDLIYLVLMASYGDATYLGSIYFGGSVENFVSMMNKRAKELGLKSTHYQNPVGLHDEQNYTTARDTYILTKHALENALFEEVSNSSRYSMPATNMSPARTLSTTNLMHDSSSAAYFYTYAKGVKTGYTDEAGRCLVSTAAYNGYHYMCLLFGCPPNAGTRYEFLESANLYRWAFSKFKLKSVADTQNPVCEVTVNLSLDTDFVSLYVEKSLLTVLPEDENGSTVTIKPNFKENFSIDAPIKKGQVIGTADVIYAEKVIGTVNLISGENIKKSALLTAWENIKKALTSVYAIAVYAAIVLFILGFILAVILMNRGRSKKRKVKYVPYKGDE